MRHRLAVVATLAVLGAALPVTGCASLEPEPCTQDWVDWKKDRILSAFARDHVGDIGFVRDISDVLDSGQPSGVIALRLAAAAPRVGRLVTDFTDRAVPEVRSAIAQCGTGPRAGELFADMLRKEGVDENTLAWVQTLSVLMDNGAT
ncbi:MAG: hypothetical protein R3C52_00160 [Hyphomonadaceae bacterium]